MTTSSLWYHNDYAFKDQIQAHKPLSFFKQVDKYKIFLNFFYGSGKPVSIMVYDENSNLLKLFSEHTDIEAYDHSLEVLNYAKTLYEDDTLLDKIADKKENSFNLLF